MSDDSYDIVQTIPKGAREEVRVALSEFHGATFLDIRLFANLGGEDRAPTRKGVTLRLTALDSLIEALEALRERAKRRGLIGGGR